LSETDETRVVAAFLHTGLVHIAQKLGPLGDGILVIKLAAGGPQSVGELAERENLAPHRVEQALATLSERGWVRRRPDGRWAATREGIETIQQGRQMRIDFLARGMSEMTPDEVELLGRAANLLNRLASTT
jgi:DNA-binding MarR family transcriptional regulator